MSYTHKTRGTCSTQITFNINDGRIYNVNYEGGCNGNLKAVSKLVEGQKIEDVIDKLEGITCGMRKTSCADQLAEALKKVKEEN